MAPLALTAKRQERSVVSSVRASIGSNAPTCQSCRAAAAVVAAATTTARSPPFNGFLQVRVLLLLAAVALFAVSSLHLLRGNSSSCGSGGGAAAGRPLPAVERWEPCERAQLNETILQQWGCRVFHKTCFDQVRMLFKQLLSPRHLPSSSTFPTMPPHRPASHCTSGSHAAA